MQRDLPPNLQSLRQGHCVPCEGGTSPLSDSEEIAYMDATKNWTLKKEAVHKIERDFEFKNFEEAIDFVNKIAEIASKQGHHPDISLHNYKFVRVTLYTHAISGLSTNDFILAVMIDDTYL